ncbi:RGS domain-containing protein [Rhizoctonia solani]|uniref:RGS domain-containing protein n=1 Tax=Rhizoctonia solani TaxID=456999 RepID=A0A8H8PCS8_9AGAM|nr:RGS domain-containing protein [Rhizoctonia solani]QRW27681.1 RGS domain-containing protein [Rhizoctonia solani]
MLIARKRQQRRRTRAQRPPPHWFSIGSFRSLGSRLWNPPPASEEERYSWFITPKYRISLEDVIADKHPSPLSRQDFEDYLHHVEGLASNLYFHEWVHNYRERYREWAKSVLPSVTVGLPSSSKYLYHSRELWERLKDCQDRQLKDEFSSAKSTFFQPGAPMRLNIDASLRDRVLLIPNLPPSQQLTDRLPSYPNQPEPSIFDPILEQVNQTLEAAFARFLRLAFCNAGLIHCILGHLLGLSILAAGLALWCLGIISHQRGHIAGGLPLIWIGVWFLLVTSSDLPWGLHNRLRATTFPLGDSKALPAGAVAPPIFSIAPAPNDTSTLSSYSFGRKPSGASHGPPLATPPLPSPQPTYQSQIHGKRRWSEGVLRIWGQHKKEFTIKSADQKMLDRRAAVELLPPARRTKNLPRASLVLDVEQANELAASLLPISVTQTPRATFELTYARRNAALDLTSELQAAGFGPEGRPDSPFTEENDFGIVVSDAYHEDTPDDRFHRPSPWTIPPTLVSNGDYSTLQQDWKPSAPESLDRLAPLIQLPDQAAPRRRTMPDVYTPIAETLTIDYPSWSRRGSKSSDLEAGGELYRPWPRTLLGPMTLVHSPLVRRAQWVIIWRTAAISLVVTFGMTLGLIR